MPFLESRGNICQVVVVASANDIWMYCFETWQNSTVFTPPFKVAAVVSESKPTAYWLAYQTSSVRLLDYPNSIQILSISKK